MRTQATQTDVNKQQQQQAQQAAAAAAARALQQLNSQVRVSF